MTNQAITVWLSDMNQLADILCEIDDEQASTLSRESIKTLVDKAHKTLCIMLGKHAAELYREEEPA